MNVQSIHNATFASTLPTGYLNQTRDLANWHEYNVFSDSSFDGIGNGAHIVHLHTQEIHEMVLCQSHSAR